jgi:hypothetical protein
MPVMVKHFLSFRAAVLVFVLARRAALIMNSAFASEAVFPLSAVGKIMDARPHGQCGRGFHTWVLAS